jgi:hypothetical protein
MYACIIYVCTYLPTDFALELHVAHQNARWAVLYPAAPLRLHQRMGPSVFLAVGMMSGGLTAYEWVSHGLVGAK